MWRLINVFRGVNLAGTAHYSYSKSPGIGLTHRSKHVNMRFAVSFKYSLETLKKGPYLGVHKFISAYLAGRIDFVLDKLYHFQIIKRF